MQSGTLLTIFQSTLPRRERLLLRNNVHSDCIFQSTLPRRERQERSNLLILCFLISIHTPTKGATALIPPMCVIPTAISIHTPTKGATVIVMVMMFMTFMRISIHTPTKGATAILTNNFLIFCSISLINFILYLQIIQILFIFRYKFIFYFIF